jgi:hypothetical protein
MVTGMADAVVLPGGIGGTPLLIGKSLGTNAAGVAVDRGLPAVWEAIDGFLDTIGWPG